MPQYPPTDKRHPVNRCRLVHLAALEAGRRGISEGLLKAPEEGRGPLIPTDLWQAWSDVGFAVSRQQSHNYTLMMESFLMVRIHDRRGVELLPLEDIELPPIEILS